MLYKQKTSAIIDTNTKKKDSVMKIKLIGDVKTIMSSKTAKNNYFAWPSVTKLQNGKIAVTASGYRNSHVCPFGKAVISYSEDEGETYTLPAPCIDTPLDDRDAGILAFGKSGVIVTSFNNTVAFQRQFSKQSKMREGYLDTITKEEEETYLGSEFVISHDYGVTFGELHKSPITSPHGPIQLRNGKILWIGRVFSKADTDLGEADRILAYEINTENGQMQYISTLPIVMKNGMKMLSCEPCAIETTDGTIICHIRVQNGSDSFGANVFTIYQTISKDQGVTWSEPQQILEDQGGAPAHLLQHSSGVLICTYGYRQKPYGIKVMFSHDQGITWETGYTIYDKGINGDLGYPCSIELDNKDILTVFYAKLKKDSEPAVILQQKWRLENEI